MARRQEPINEVQEEPKEDGPVTEEELSPITDHIIGILVEKDREYGSSWKKRGGIGAFMMLARKWDRLENFASDEHSSHDRYDILERAVQDSREEGVEADIDDLIGYLLLVQVEIKKRKAAQKF